MKHKLQALLILGILILFVPVIGQLEYADYWYDGTVINGNDCSNLTLEETISMMSGADYTLTLVSRDGGTDTITAEEISLETDVESQLTALFEEQHQTFYIMKLFSPDDALSFTPNVTYDADALQEAFASSVVVAGSDDYEIEMPSEATVIWDGEKFTATEHDEGNTLKVDEAYPYVVSAVESLTQILNLYTLDVYETIQVSVSVEDREALAAEANAYALHWITWELDGDVTEELTPDILKDFVTISFSDYTVTFDEDALCDWIEDLCLEYKTVGTERSFTTHDGEVITVSGGDYGWQLNYSSMCESTLEAVNTSDADAVSAYVSDPSDENREALSMTIEAVYKQTGYQIADGSDIDWDPDNYSEVDIGEQMVYVYKDGVLAYSAKCVTGLPNGTRDTTTGVWYIKDKKTSYTLTSETYGYSTPTKYWIRITWSGIGYHYMSRSDWSSWSSSLYLTAGSHGCINLQLADAEAIYGLVSLYDAVIIHQ